MFIIVLKVLYILWLVVYMYLDMLFTGILAFLRVTFFGL